MQCVKASDVKMRLECLKAVELREPNVAYQIETLIDRGLYDDIKEVRI